ncbi:MAG: hypothetical protein ACLPSW_03710, partial [Roseiarcus sp.]
SARDTLARFCARRVVCWFAFTLASALRSIVSAAGRPALFDDFPTTMAESDFSWPSIIGFDSSSSRCSPKQQAAPASHETSQVPACSLLT